MPSLYPLAQASRPYPRADSRRFACGRNPWDLRHQRRSAIRNWSAHPEKSRPRARARDRCPPGPCPSRARCVGDGDAVARANLFVQQLGVVRAGRASADTGLIPLRPQRKPIAGRSFLQEEGHHARFRTLGVEDIPMPVGEYCALRSIAVDRERSRRGHDTCRSSSACTTTSTATRRPDDRWTRRSPAPRHRSCSDRSPAACHPGASAAIPTQFGVTMEIAPHNAVRLAADGRRVSRGCAFRSAASSAWPAFTSTALGGGLPEPAHRARPRALESSRQKPLPQGAVIIAVRTVHRSARQRPATPLEFHTALIRVLERPLLLGSAISPGPSAAVETGEAVFPDSPSARTGNGNRPVVLAPEVLRILAATQTDPRRRKIRAADTHCRRQRRSRARLALFPPLPTIARICASANTTKARACRAILNRVALVLAPIGLTGFPCHPDPIRRVHCHRRASLKARRARDRHFRLAPVCRRARGKEHIVVAVLVAVVSDPRRALAVERDRRAPSRWLAAGNAHIVRPAAPSKFSERCCCSSRESPARPARAALAVRNQPRIDVGRGPVGSEALERAPLLLGGIEAPGVESQLLSSCCDHTTQTRFDSSTPACGMPAIAAGVSGPTGNCSTCHSL